QRPTISVPTDPPDQVNPTAGATYAGRCPADALTLNYQLTDAALGARFATVTARNDSKQPCVLQGRPDLAFASADLNAVRPTLVPGAGWTEGSGTVAAIQILPGQSASAELTWRAGAPTNSVVQIWVAPWVGAPRTVIVADMDVGDGTTVTVSAWIIA
ncbi:MAG: DUF4232 domain-containing protein, partial [Propionibacteriaceae bacterium]|nr:DUF4232 domain-containing protein [Propionibacteriaceae bacterium]